MAKKKLLLVLYLIILVSSTTLGLIKVDDFYSIKIPNQEALIDTLVNNNQMLQLYSSNGTESYMIQRIKLNSKGEYSNILPFNLESLKQFYQNFMLGYIKNMKESGLYFIDSTQVKIKDFLGYKINFGDVFLKTCTESNILILNDCVYTAMYFNSLNFNIENKNSFMNSIDINTNNNPTQYTDRPQSNSIAYIAGRVTFVLLMIVAIILIIRLVR